VKATKQNQKAGLIKSKRFLAFNISFLVGRKKWLICLSFSNYNAIGW